MNDLKTIIQFANSIFFETHYIFGFSFSFGAFFLFLFLGGLIIDALVHLFK